jgi:hypothetical protein
MARSCAYMTDYTAIYVAQPDIPAGMTIAEYRRSRPRRASWWRRVLGGRS